MDEDELAAAILAAEALPPHVLGGTKGAKRATGTTGGTKQTHRGGGDKPATNRAKTEGAGVGAGAGAGVGAGAGAGAGAALAGRKRGRDGSVEKEPPPAKRNRTTGKDREQTRDEALATLLENARGFPLPYDSSRFRLDAPRLRAFRDGARVRRCPGNSALSGGVYWIHKDAAAAVAAAYDGTATAAPPAPPAPPAPSAPPPAPTAPKPMLSRGKGGAAAGPKKEGKWYEEAPWWPQLTVQPKASGMNPRPPPPFPMWVTHASPEKRDYIGVPRFFGLSHFGVPAKDLRSKGEPMAPGIAFDTSRPFRPEQEAAFKALMEALLHSWGGAFLEADCGFGKTAIIIRVLLALGVKAAILCTQEVLMRQMLYDIRGKPWTWPDLCSVLLAADGSVSVPAGATCPVTGAPLAGLRPADIARTHCVGGAKKKTCVRLASRAGYEAWSARGAVVSAGGLGAGAGAGADTEHGCHAFTCPTCGGTLGPAPAWETPSPPKRGWAEGARVGWLQGAYRDKKGRVSKRCDVMDKDIVIVSMASAAQCEYPWASFGIGAVAIDEAHKAGSPTLSQILFKLAAAYVLAVSATPGRLDGTEHGLYWQMGPTAFVYKRTREVTGVVGAVRVRQIEYTRGERKEIRYRDGRIGFATMVNTLTMDDERNRLILALAAHAATRGGRKKTLIITSTIEHALLLVRSLKAIGFHDTALLKGGVKPAAVAHAQHPSTRMVVATYHYLSEGYDDPRIDTMILAAPRSSVQQTIGRCERTMEGKLVPLVYDICDGFSAFEGMAWKRHKFYRSRAFAIARESDADVWARLEGAGAAAAEETEAVPTTAEAEAAARELDEAEDTEGVESDVEEGGAGDGSDCDDGESSDADSNADSDADST